MRIGKYGAVMYSKAEALSLATQGRRYYDFTRGNYPGFRGGWGGCEHCDSEHTALTRADDLRGGICPICDSALDEMFDEEPR